MPSHKVGVLRSSVAVLGVATGLIFAPTVASAATFGDVIAHPVADVSTDSAGAFGASAAGVSASVSTLQRLSSLPSAQLGSLLRSTPDLAASVLAAPPAAAEVSAWWSAMDSRHRAGVSAASPALVGNLDGLPPAARDAANRSSLATGLSVLAATADVGRSAAESTRVALRILSEVDRALASDTDEPRSLLSLDTAGTGTAAVVVGDLATADYVTVLVPGMFFTVENQIVDWTGIAHDLYLEQQSLLRQLDKDATVATVAWIGYETPNLTNIASLDAAHTAKESLASLVDGIRSLREDAAPVISLVAHSYGSTAALMALADGSMAVDNLALIGSPGSAAQSVTELGMAHDSVWVGEAAWDPVPFTAFFGSDPGADSYGAQTMSVDGGTDPFGGADLVPAVGHIGYFTHGSEAMRNFALIGIDEGALVAP